MRCRHNSQQSVYAPNGTAGPAADPRYEEAGWAVSGDIGRYAYEPHSADDDFVQPRALSECVLTLSEQDNLVSNIVGHLTNAVRPELLVLAVEYWRNVHPNLGARVAVGVGLGDGTRSDSDSRGARHDGVCRGVRRPVPTAAS